MACWRYAHNRIHVKRDLVESLSGTYGTYVAFASSKIQQVVSGLPYLVYGLSKGCDCPYHVVSAMEYRYHERGDCQDSRWYWWRTSRWSRSVGGELGAVLGEVAQGNISRSVHAQFKIFVHMDMEYTRYVCTLAMPSSWILGIWFDPELSNANRLQVLERQIADLHAQRSQAVGLLVFDGDSVIMEFIISCNLSPYMYKLSWGICAIYVHVHIRSVSWCGCVYVYGS